MMDWCVDFRVEGALEGAADEVVAHLRRHAADPVTVDLVRSQVRDTLASDAGQLRWVSLDWEGMIPKLIVRDVVANSWPEPGPRGAGLVPVRPGVALAHQVSADLALVAGPEVTVELGVARPPEPSLDPHPTSVPATGELTPEAFLAAVAGFMSREPHGRRSQEELAAWAGASLGARVEEDLRRRRHVNGGLSPRQVAEAFVDYQRAAGGDFFVVTADDRRAVLGNRRCPFGAAVAGSPALCRSTSAAIGAIAARSAGEARVTLDERIALGDDQCRLIVETGPVSDRPTSHRYTSPPAGWPTPALVEEAGTPVPGFNVALFLRLPRDRLSVPIARHLVKDALDKVGVVEQDAADVELALAEACTNVLTHSGPGDAYDVSLTVGLEQCDIRIVDVGRGFDFESLSGEMSTTDAESGRGVALMRAVMDQVRFSSQPERGTVVHLVKRLHFDDSRPARRLLLAALDAAAGGEDPETT